MSCKHAYGDHDTCDGCLESILSSKSREIDGLKSELKIGNKLCAVLTDKKNVLEDRIAELEKALRNILKHCKIVMPHGYNLMTTYRIAEQALSGEEDKK